jgi:RimJ/RimL family protein N-acetyltransferase
VDVFCQTDRLLLRRFTEADLDDLEALDADPAVMRFINGGRPTPRETIRDEVLPRFMSYDEHHPEHGAWAGVERSTGEFIGWFALRPPDRALLDQALPEAGLAESAAPGVVELGYRLRSSAWGKGFAAEGSRALIRKAFHEYGVQRVVAQTMTVNTASRRVMEKCGLSYVRTFFLEWPEAIEGTEQGDVEYALDRADFVRLSDH